MSLLIAVGTMTLCITGACVAAGVFLLTLTKIAGDVRV